jgi:hypothetical protein
VCGYACVCVCVCARARARLPARGWLCVTVWLGLPVCARVRVCARAHVGGLRVCKRVGGVSMCAGTRVRVPVPVSVQLADVPAWVRARVLSGFQLFCTLVFAVKAADTYFDMAGTRAFQPRGSLARMRARAHRRRVRRHGLRLGPVHVRESPLKARPALPCRLSPFLSLLLAVSVVFRFIISCPLYAFALVGFKPSPVRVCCVASR